MTTFAQMKRIFKILSQLPPYLNTAIVGAIICYLTLFPDPLPDETPHLFEHADKLVHAIMFYGLASAGCFDYYRQHSYRFTQKALAAILAMSIAAGGVIELLQWVMGLGRSLSVMDFIADTIGAFIAYTTSPKIIKSNLRQ